MYTRESSAVPISVATIANTVVSTGIINTLWLIKRRANLSTAISIIPVFLNTINMPPIIKVKKTISPASIKPFGIIEMKSTIPTGLEEIKWNESASTISRPSGPFILLNCPEGMKYVDIVAITPKINKMT